MVDSIVHIGVHHVTRQEYDVSDHLLTLLTALVVLCAPVRAETLQVFGGDTFAPTTYIVNGEPAGALVDILKKVSEKTGDSYQVRLQPWTRAYDQAVRGEGAIVGLSMTPARLELFDFSEPMYYNELQLIVAKGNEFPFKRLDDLKGRTIGGGMGVSYGVEADNAIEAGLFTLERDTDATLRLQKVLAGQLQAAIIGHGDAGLDYLVANHPRLQGRRDDLRALPKPLDINPLYFAVKKTLQKRDVIDRFNKALQELRRSGALKPAR